MERILWLDGRVTLINAEEAYENTQVEQRGDRDVYILLHNGFEFEWHYDTWMQI